MKVVPDTSLSVYVIKNFFKFGNCYPKFRRVYFDKLDIQIGLTSI